MPFGDCRMSNIAGRNSKLSAVRKNVMLASLQNTSCLTHEWLKKPKNKASLFRVRRGNGYAKKRNFLFNFCVLVITSIHGMHSGEAGGIADCLLIFPRGPIQEAPCRFRARRSIDHLSRRRARRPPTRPRARHFLPPHRHLVTVP